MPKANPMNGLLEFTPCEYELLWRPAARGGQPGATFPIQFSAAALIVTLPAPEVATQLMMMRCPLEAAV